MLEDGDLTLVVKDRGDRLEVGFTTYDYAEFDSRSSLLILPIPTNPYMNTAVGEILAAACKAVSAGRSFCSLLSDLATEIYKLGQRFPEATCEKFVLVDGELTRAGNQKGISGYPDRIDCNYPHGAAELLAAIDRFDSFGASRFLSYVMTEVFKEGQKSQSTI